MISPLGQSMKGKVNSDRAPVAFMKSNGLGSLLRQDAKPMSQKRLNSENKVAQHHLPNAEFMRKSKQYVNGESAVGSQPSSPSDASKKQPIFDNKSLASKFAYG